MGRASWVAFMPTSSMSGGSLAPIENSPPGIQTMPAGAVAGAEPALATVGRNLAPPDAFAGDICIEPLLAPTVWGSEERRFRTTRRVTTTASARIIKIPVPPRKGVFFTASTALLVFVTDCLPMLALPLSEHKLHSRCTELK